MIRLLMVVVVVVTLWKIVVVVMRCLTSSRDDYEMVIIIIGGKWRGISGGNMMLNGVGGLQVVAVWWYADESRGREAGETG